MTRALVLGGGGLAGIAWQLGLLAGIADAGADARDADVVVGTSAGSVVGALLRQGTDLDELFDRQLRPAPHELHVALDLEQVAAVLLGPLADAHGEQDARRRLGTAALSASAVSEADRRAAVAGRLDLHDWPARPLLVAAVDTGTGELVVFDSSSGVALVDAVAASCAVPGVWPPVTIGGTRYMDGGVRSITNADLAAAADAVLVLAPSRGFSPNPFGPERDAELAALSGRVLVVDADEASTAAFGADPLDPATRGPSARAGRAQAATVVDDVRDLWLSP
jgi:NTE family protein